MPPHSSHVCDRLHEFYSLLREHFGYAEQWWPGTPLEITLTALLVQQCNWTTAYQAIGRLRERRVLELPQLAAADPEVVESCIHPVSFSPTKSKRLVRLAQAVLDRGCQDIETYLRSSSTEVLRRDLLSFPGIGEETADCILLFAAEGHPSFVIDSYTRRVFERLGLFPDLEEGFWRKSYGRLKRFFESHLSAGMAEYAGFRFRPGTSRQVALFRDFHAQIVELGKHHCVKTSPRCQTRGNDGWSDYIFCREHCRENECCGCPLTDRCRWSQMVPGELSPPG